MIPSPRLSPDATYYICDTCNREWKLGDDPGCAACAAAFEQRELLLALAERCEREGPSRELDRAIEVASRGMLAQQTFPPHFTTSLDSAAALIPKGWFIETLSDVYGDGLIFVRLACPDPIRDATGIGGRTRTLTLCAAALRARAA